MDLNTYEYTVAIVLVLWEIQNLSHTYMWGDENNNVFALDDKYYSFTLSIIIGLLKTHTAFGLRSALVLVSAQCRLLVTSHSTHIRFDSILDEQRTVQSAQCIHICAPQLQLQPSSDRLLLVGHRIASHRITRTTATAVAVSVRRESEWEAERWGAPLRAARAAAGALKEVIKFRAPLLRYCCGVPFARHNRILIRRTALLSAATRYVTLRYSITLH